MPQIVPVKHASARAVYADHIQCMYILISYYKQIESGVSLIMGRDVYDGDVSSCCCVNMRQNLWGISGLSFGQISCKRSLLYK